MDYEEMKQIVDTHVCGKCGAELVIRSNPPHPDLVLSCGDDHSHQGWQQKLSYSQARRQGFEVPFYIKPHKKEPRMNEGKLPAIYDAHTGKLAIRDQALEAIDYAKSIDLVPELGHICLYFGKPWVTIDGWYYRFRKKFPGGKVITKPLNPAEREALKVDDHIHAWIAESFDAKGNPLSCGYGYASDNPATPLAHGSAVESKWPWRMAEKRAEEDCLRKAVPLSLTNQEEVAQSPEGEPNGNKRH